MHIARHLADRTGYWHEAVVLLSLEHGDATLYTKSPTYGVMQRPGQVENEA